MGTGGQRPRGLCSCGLPWHMCLRSRDVHSFQALTPGLAWKGHFRLDLLVLPVPGERASLSVHKPSDVVMSDKKNGSLDFLTAFVLR